MKIQTPPPNERLKRIAWWGGSGLLALLAGVMLWNRALASRVRARTAALRSSEERFSKAFHHSPDAMFISRHADGVTLEANLGAARMFGGTREEFLGGRAPDDGWGYLSAEVREGRARAGRAAGRIGARFRGADAAEKWRGFHRTRLVRPNRNRELVQLLAEGKSNKEAADALGITLNTVETHRKNVMSKLRLRSASDLVRYAIRNNLAQP